ncbi:MAG: hypothetical protein LBP56_06605 [Odoribacteraceae bacterium]|jgi:hypothetical protein|nr:hypothetical protein [Odoribacteraceae bacterium]
MKTHPTSAYTLLPACVLCYLLLLFSCHEDKGNYAYLTLDEVTIDTAGTGVLPAYALYRYDPLQIAPLVYLNGKRVEADEQMDQQLDCLWTIYKATTGGTAYPVDTIGRGLMLDTIITQPAGVWIVRFTVTRKETGISTFMKINLQIDETISDGWMVLYEKEGNTDAGLIVNDRIKKGVTRERLLLDIYSTSNGGQRLSGKPVAILHSTVALGSAEVLLASERDLVAVEKNSFGLYLTMDELFWTPPDTRSISYLGANNTRREVTIVNNRIHYVNYMSSGTFRINAFGPACTGDHGLLAPWLSSYFSNSFEAVAYDQTRQRFLCVEANGVAVDTLSSKDKTAFDVNHVGMEMLFSDFGRSNYEYSLMRQGTTHALLVSNFATTNRLSDKIAIAKYDMSDCPAIAGVSSIAAGGLGEILYYASGADLYLFKYNVTGADRIQHAWSAPPGETITCVRLQKFYNPTFVLTGLLINNYGVIYIATWNETTRVGTVYQLNANPSNGTLDDASRATYTGFGKVKEMGWKWTL